MSVEITRQTGTNGHGTPVVGTTLALNTAADTTARLNYIGMSGGNLLIPTGSSIASITFYGCDTPTGTPLPVYDSTKATPVASAITGISKPGIIPIPDECFGIPYLYPVSDAAGNVVFIGKG